MRHATTGAGTILFGGSGFLGPNILEQCPDMISVGRTPPTTSNRHVPIETLDDLRALQDVDFEKVIYIIGNTDHGALEKEEIARGEPTAFDYHVIPLLRVMEQLKKYPIKQFIHFSSILLYDEKRLTNPVSEHAPIDPYRSRYIVSKYLGEEICKFYSQWVPVINIRMSNLYGPSPLRRFDLVHRLIRQLLEKGSGQVWSTSPKRDFIHVIDAADAVIELLDTEYTGTLNLGTGTMTSVGRVVEILRDLTGCPIEDLGHPTTGPQEFRVDMTTLERIIPTWQPRFAIEEGVAHTYERMKAWRDAAVRPASPQLADLRA